jgi:hypothetical protein
MISHGRSILSATGINAGRRKVSALLAAYQATVCQTRGGPPYINNLFMGTNWEHKRK